MIEHDKSSFQEVAAARRVAARQAPDSKIKRSTVKTTRTTHEIILTGRQIAEMVLRDHGIPVGDRDVHVTFDVPCGGDHSGTTLNVSTSSPITLTWTETEEREA